MKKLVTLFLLLSYNVMFSQDTIKHMISVKESYVFNDYGVSYTNYYKKRKTISFDLAFPVFHFMNEFIKQNGIAVRLSYEYKLKDKNNYPFLQIGFGSRYNYINRLHLVDGTSEYRDNEKYLTYAIINWGYSVNIRSLNFSFILGVSPTYKYSKIYNRILFLQNGSESIIGEDYISKGFYLYPDINISIGYKF